MNFIRLFVGLAGLWTFVPYLHAETLVELHILAGQSNAQGYQGDAARYPEDSMKQDSQIPFFYNAPGCGSSNLAWGTLGPQTGRFPQGYFGPEMAFARALLQAGARPAVFKFTMPSTSLAKVWKGPGEGGALDAMCTELIRALRLLKEQHSQVKVCSFTWVQGESDAETDDTASKYATRLSSLVYHIRELLHEPTLPVILGLDEQHPWVQKRPIVVEAQKKFVSANPHMGFLSMRGLEKVDSSHLTPEALVQHGNRLFETYRTIKKGVGEAPNPSR
jgi:hypothetical protein